MTHPVPPYKTTPKIRDFSGTPKGRGKNYFCITKN